MNVLSLFDGISCGRVALDRAGIQYRNYYTSEIEKNAIKVAEFNYPDSIQLGSVENWKSWDLPKIDLLIGGSPCQNLSVAGKREGINGEKSKLFFYYVRILKALKPKWFLYENVASMKSIDRTIISSKLGGTTPIMINSSLVSAQNRKRLYWTNIPGIKQPEDRGILFGRKLKRLKHGYIKEEIKFFKKFPSLCAQDPCSKYIPIDGKRITPEDCENLQTLPKNYTATVQKTKRFQVIGNGWNVNVISHIFSFLKDEIEFKNLIK